MLAVCILASVATLAGYTVFGERQVAWIVARPINIRQTNISADRCRTRYAALLAMHSSVCIFYL